MDIALLKTFLAVSDTGSFIAASERLHVTQSAVSLRVQRLEDMLGHELFIRSRTGTEPTASGKEFTAYALSLLRTWEQARQQIAVPEGYSRSLLMGGQFSLWPSLGFRWLDRMIGALPDLAIRAELGMPESLAQSMADGVMQVCLTYAPVMRPGLSVEKVMEDELVLVAPWKGATTNEVRGRYAFIDWGPEFLSFHNARLPDLANAGLTLAMGAASAPFLLARNLAAYLPARVAGPLLATGQLHLVEKAPAYTHVAWSVWRDDLDEDLAEVARKTLSDVARQAAKDTSAVAETVGMKRH